MCAFPKFFIMHTRLLNVKLPHLLNVNSIAVGIFELPVATC